LVHPAALPPERLLAECEVRFLRRSGPGGQNRNKVETAVVLRHRPTGLLAEANERRRQADNRREAVFRLRVELALNVRAQPEGVPSTLWRSRCPNGRIVVNPRHEDFPVLLAEALDVLTAAKMDIKVASAQLACSPSQLTRFLKEESRALAIVNAARADRGLLYLL
jgi:hypothetical protein